MPLQIGYSPTFMLKFTTIRRRWTGGVACISPCTAWRARAGALRLPVVPSLWNWNGTDLELLQFNTQVTADSGTRPLIGVGNAELSWRELY